MAVELGDVTVGTGEHVVQFYEQEPELVRTVGGYLTAAMEEDAVAIVVATRAHCGGFDAELEAAGHDPTALRQEGRLIFLDAPSTLEGFLHENRIDPNGFVQVVGAVVRYAATTGRPIRAYGEMVALLWEAENVLAAIELEKAWNALAREVPLALVCGYRSGSARGAEHAQALRQVCQLHSSVRDMPAMERPDVTPPSELSAQFPAERSAPGRARHFVTDALRRWGQTDALVADTELLVSELATNAIIHARSPFSVAVRRHARGVRLAVADASPIRPVLHESGPLAVSGRGLRLVDMLAADWGVELAGDGKTVWAELRPE